MTKVVKIKLPRLHKDKFFVTKKFYRGNFFSKNACIIKNSSQ